MDHFYIFVDWFIFYYGLIVFIFLLDQTFVIKDL